jgi:hypothetical protein
MEKAKPILITAAVVLVLVKLGWGGAGANTPSFVKP